MSLAERITSFSITASDSSSHLWEISLILFPLLLLTGLRGFFLFSQYKSWIVSMLRFCIFSSLMLVLTFVLLVVVAKSSSLADQNFFQARSIVLLGIGSVLGLLNAFLLGRYFEPWVIQKLEVFIRHSGDTDKLTDIRSVEQKFENISSINFEKEFKTALAQDKVYLGTDYNNQSITVSRATWKTNHVQIMGPPGTGKGVQAAITLTQSIMYGDAVYVLDPKHDEWAPNVFRSACNNADVPFHFINLRESVPQLNPIFNADANEVAEALYAGLSLGRTGSDADFYRLDDRKVARIASEIAGSSPLTLKDMLRQTIQVVDDELRTGAKSFFSSLGEIAELSCVQTKAGVDLSSPLRTGGCVYIVGSMRNEPILYLQKMLFIRIIQLVEKQGQNKRHCSIFLDEFKFLLSQSAINALGSIRDKGCNMLLAHQSLGDLSSIGPDINEQAVKTTVLDTTPIKWLYRSADWETAKWISQQTGEIIIDTHSTTKYLNPELSELKSHNATVSEATRNLFDSNTVMRLPKFWAVCIGVGIPTLAKVEPIKVTKFAIHVSPAPTWEDDKLNLLKRVPIESNNVEPSMTVLPSMFDVDPSERLLRFLYEETWTSMSITSRLLSECTLEDIEEIVSGYIGNKLIRKTEFSFSDSTHNSILGISKYGMHYVLEKFSLEIERPFFYSSSVNPISLNHKMDIQMMRIAAENNGWQVLENINRKRINKKGSNYPDKVLVRPDGTRVAIEVERTIKQSTRYESIFLAHLKARRNRFWDEIYYLSPTESIKKKVKKNYDEITTLSYLGETIEINDSYRAPFHFFTYSEDWLQHHIPNTSNNR